MIKEDVTFKKNVGSTKTTDLTNLGIFLYNISCRWERHTSKLGRDTVMAVNVGRAEQVELRKFNPLNAELNPICYLLALLVHHFLHVSRIRVKSLTIRLLMSYIYGGPILDVSRSYTTTHHSR